MSSDGVPAKAQRDGTKEDPREGVGSPGQGPQAAKGSAVKGGGVGPTGSQDKGWLTLVVSDLAMVAWLLSTGGGSKVMPSEGLDSDQ